MNFLSAPPYELMMRGIDIQLVVQEILRDSPADHRDAWAPTFTYTTKEFAPHMSEVSTLEDYTRFVPRRARGFTYRGPASKHYPHFLYVANTDLAEALKVLRAHNVTLNAMEHPTEAWYLQQP
jgi:hypothetical protein